MSVRIRSLVIIGAVVVAVAAVAVVKSSRQRLDAEARRGTDGTSPMPVGPPSAEGGRATSVPASAAAPAGVPRLVDLGATKCIPCKMMAPILEELKKTYAGRLEVVFIDVWENPDAIGRYAVRTIPTQVFYDAAGKELYRHEGFYAKEDILAKWKELGVSLRPAR